MKHGPHIMDVPREALGRLATANKPWDVWYICRHTAGHPSKAVRELHRRNAARLWGTDERILFQSAVEGLNKYVPSRLARDWLDTRWAEIRSGANRIDDALRLVRFWREIGTDLSETMQATRHEDLVSVGASLTRTGGTHHKLARVDAACIAEEARSADRVDASPFAAAFGIGPPVDVDPPAVVLGPPPSPQCRCAPVSAPPPFDFEAYNGLPPKRGPK